MKLKITCGDKNQISGCLRQKLSVERRKDCKWYKKAFMGETGSAAWLCYGFVAVHSCQIHQILNGWSLLGKLFLCKVDFKKQQPEGIRCITYKVHYMHWYKWQLISHQKTMEAKRWQNDIFMSTERKNKTKQNPSSNPELFINQNILQNIG